MLVGQAAAVGIRAGGLSEEKPVTPKVQAIIETIKPEVRENVTYAIVRTIQLRELTIPPLKEIFLNNFHIYTEY